jgi:anti-sigma-K factor RskA
VLDVACGSGRHVRWLAERGCTVTAVDRDAQALAPLATIAASNGQVAWQIEVTGDHSLLRAVAAEGVRPSPGRSFELWALPDNGDAPVSLGVLPDTGRAEHALSDRQRQALGRASKVAVSFEPAGGSPTGAPTGPVLFVAERIKSA